MKDFNLVKTEHFYRQFLSFQRMKRNDAQKPNIERGSISTVQRNAHLDINWYIS